MLSDYILPDTTYLERWDVCVPPASVTVPGVGLRCPAVGSVDSKTGQYFPILAENRIMEDILIDVAKKLQLPGIRRSCSLVVKAAEHRLGLLQSAFCHAAANHEGDRVPRFTGPGFDNSHG